MQKDQELHVNSSVYKKEHWEAICHKTKNCSFCKPHRVENVERHPRTNKYKNKRRETIRRNNVY